MTEKPKRKAKNRRSQQQIVVGLILFLGIIFVSCTLFMMRLRSVMTLHCYEVTGEEAINCIEDLLQYDLPESSMNVFFYQGSYSERWLPNVRVRFTAKTDEIKTWLENPYFCFRDPLPEEQIFLPTQKDYSDILQQ